LYKTDKKIESLMLVLTEPEEVKRREMKLRKELVYTSERNKEIIRNYYKKLRIERYAVDTIFTRLAILRFIIEHYSKDFDDITQQDVDDLLFEIEVGKTVWGKESSPATKAMKRQCLRSFLIFLFDKQILKDKLYEDISVKIPKTTVTADDIYTEVEVNAMIGQAINPRDKAFIALLYDAGGRIGEILPMKLKQVEDRKNEIEITVTGKTGTRALLLDFSIFYVRQWINSHPDKNNPEAYLWCHVNDWGREGHIEYDTMLKNLKRIGQKAGITKRVYNHAFRHSSVTKDAEYLTEALNKNKHGWTPSSPMLSNYSHLTSTNLKKAQREKMGLAPVTIKKGLNICSNCHEANPYDFIHCGRCGNPLTPEAKGEEAKVKDAMAEMMKDPEFMRIFQEKLLGMTA
jgi:site-specific recombinase XerD